MEIIRNFKSITKKDVTLAGGKGASLGEITNAGIPVPPGYVILSAAFEEFIKSTKVNIEIDSELDHVDIEKIHTIENASETINALILEKEIPETIKKEIIRAFKILDTKFVAVRSSATSEDSASAAWAGQLDSFLNTTETTLLENVKKCWASLFTPRAIFYRFEKGLHKEKVSVAVVVQKMINSEESGIAFSVHPVTQDYNQLIIEAGFGLGEAIVSGQITPDSYVITKDDLNILDKNISVQTRGLYRVEIGGNVWKDIEEIDGKKQVLSDKEIIELSRLIIKIENHYGFPVDVEWAREGKKFYIVQSRPITTLTEENSDNEYRLIMTRDLELIGCELWDIGERIILPKKFKELLFFDPLFIYSNKRGVKIYYNFTDPKQNLQPLLNYLHKNLKFIYSIKNEFDKNCEEVRLMISKKDKSYKKLHKLIKEIWPVIAVANIYGSTDYYSVNKELKDLCIKIRNESDDVLHNGLSYLNEIIKDKIKDKKEIFNLSQFISYSEISSNSVLKEELEKRSKGYLYHKGKIIPDFKNYLKKEKIQLIEPQASLNVNSIKGFSGYNGKISGGVKVLFNLKDINKVKENDILVMPMTTPDFIQAVKKASAIVTDEGGITCHAAIVAREMKKPCVIGTKIATKVLHDGDLVEVDADNGIVKILKKS